MRERLSLLLGGDLPLDEDRRLRSHLQDCRDCRRELGAWMRTRKLLAGLSPREGMGQEFFAQLNKDILQSLRQEKRPLLGSAAPRRSWPRATAAVAAMALFLIGLNFGLSAGEPGSSLLDRPPISESDLAPSIRDPFAKTVPVGYSIDRQDLPSTLRATFERADKEAEEISAEERERFIRRYEKLRMKRNLECGEIPSDSGLNLEPSERECWELLRKCLQETRKRAKGEAVRGRD